MPEFFKFKRANLFFKINSDYTPKIHRTFIEILYINDICYQEVHMNTQQHTQLSSGLLKSRNVIAALSSIIPGLGHIYKGQYRTGACLLIISPLFIWVALILGFATAGIGLLVPFFFLILIGWHAYNSEDKRKHPAGII